MRKSKEKAAIPPVPCGYGCGRNSDGYLNVMFTEWSDEEERRAYQRGFSVTIPACRICLVNAATVSVNIPKVKT